jgi:hypothetical protein
MKFAAIVTALIISNVFRLNLASAAPHLPLKDEGLLGEVRMSILTETEFRRIYGEEWVLMNGQTIQGSDLALQFPEVTALPDARGVFLRGYNNDRPVSQGNPDGTQLGVAQNDEVGGHDHTIHRSKGDPNPGCSRIQTVAGGSSTANSECASDILRIARNSGNETRPKSVTVNIFIKIKGTRKNKATEDLLQEVQSREDKATQAILEEVRGLPQYLISNKGFTKLLDNYINAAVEQRLAKAPR